MYVAPGLMDRRLTFYRREEHGGDGFVRPVYVKTGTYWGRIDASAQRINVAFAPMAHVDARTNWSATIAEHIDVDPNGIVRESGTDVLYFVRGVITLRQLSGQRVDLESIDPTQYNTFTMYEGAEVDDGYHIVDSGSAFTTGFDEGFE